MTQEYSTFVNPEDYVTIVNKDGSKEKKRRTQHKVSFMGKTPVTTNQYLGYFPVLPEYHCTCGFKWWGAYNPDKHCLREKELITRMHGKGTY